MDKHARAVWPKFHGGFIQAIVVAFGVVATLAACADGVSRASILAPPAFDEVVESVELPSLAGKELELLGGVCPDGYSAQITKGEHPADLNGNFTICVNDVNPDDVVDDKEVSAGTCPDGFFLRQQLDHPADENGNGFVCIAKGSDTVDDILIQENAKVTGHGNVEDDLKKLEDDFSFSFVAIPIGTESEGKGQFEFHDQGRGIEVHGIVECVMTAKSTAVIIGTVTRSSDSKLPVGTRVGWAAMDNGEPGDGVDAVSRPSPLSKGPVPKDPEKQPSTECSSVKIPAPLPILSGNIQIH